MRTPAGYFFVRLEMRFAKPALSLEQQLDLLQQRGLRIGDRAAALHALAHGNYFRLRGYWMVLEEPQPDGSHRFRAGATFEHALALSAFDESLRGLVMEAASRVEVSLRTQFAFHVATAHGAHAYLDQALFLDPLKHAKCLASLKEEIDRSHEVFIKHYLRKYSDPPLPPIWAACEVMSLGSLSNVVRELGSSC